MNKFDINFTEKKDNENFDQLQDFDKLMAMANEHSVRRQFIQRGVIAMLLLTIPVALTLGYFKRDQIVSFFTVKEKQKVVMEEAPKKIILPRKMTVVEIPEEHEEPLPEAPKETIALPANEIGVEEINEPKKDILTRARPAILYDSFVRYLDKSIQFTPSDLEEGSPLSTSVTFWVNKNGKLTGFSFSDQIGESLKKKVIQALSQMPHWVPATINGEPYRTMVGFKLRFELVLQPNEENRGLIK